jgi:hypothetical protein
MSRPTGGLNKRAKLFAVEARDAAGRLVQGSQTFAMSQSEAIKQAKSAMRRNGLNEASAKFSVRALS